MAASTGYFSPEFCQHFSPFIERGLDLTPADLNIRIFHQPPHDDPALPDTFPNLLPDDSPEAKFLVRLTAIVKRILQLDQVQIHYAAVLAQSFNHHVNNKMLPETSRLTLASGLGIFRNYFITNNRYPILILNQHMVTKEPTTLGKMDRVYHGLLHIHYNALVCTPTFP